MNSFLPPSVDGLPIDKLSAVFNPRVTTASYKFFWFLGMLDEVEKWWQSEYSMNRQYTPLQIRISDLLLRMVVNAWYPLYFNIKLGSQDQLCRIRNDLIDMISNKLTDKDKYNSLKDIDYDCFLTVINKIDNSEIEEKTKDLKNNVPYRFLSPWYTDQSNKQVREKTQEKTDLMFIYTFVDNQTIQIDPSWLKYLTDNLKIVREFTYWNLCFYLQRRNPYDHFIINKIVRQKERESLASQRMIWKAAMDDGANFMCPYTRLKINKQTVKFDLDHFIPWRYIGNNLMWNLTPASYEFNRSKGDKLPIIDEQIEIFSQNQKSLLIYLNKTYGEKLKKGKTDKLPRVIDDYLSLGVTLDELTKKNGDDLVSFYKDLLNPFCLHAKRIGFDELNQETIDKYRNE